MGRKVASRRRPPSRPEKALIARLEWIKKLALDLGGNRDTAGHAAAVQILRDADRIIRVLTDRNK
jgi:hypothetical protein